jgi:hypothetical protein
MHRRVCVSGPDSLTSHSIPSAGEWGAFEEVGSRLVDQEEGLVPNIPRVLVRNKAVSLPFGGLRDTLEEYGGVS